MGNIRFLRGTKHYLQSKFNLFVNVKDFLWILSIVIEINQKP